MTYTPAQISAAHGGDVFYFDYAHADVAQTFTFGAGSWGLYKANNVAVGNSITPAFDGSGNSIAGTILFSVTTRHLDTFASSHVEWDGSGITVEYTLDGVTWNPLAEDGVVPMTSGADFDVRVTLTSGTSVLNSLTVYVLKVGATTSACGRTLTFGTDELSDAELVTAGGETISPTDASSGLIPGSIEIYAAVGQLGVTVVQGSAFSFVINPNGTTTATGCTVYVNGTPSALAPSIISGVIPYHFVVIPTVASNEQLTLGAGLTVSNLAIYAQVLNSSSVLGIYSATFNGMPTLTLSDTSVIGVTESSPSTDIYAYAWSIVSGGGQ